MIADHLVGGQMFVLSAALVRLLSPLLGADQLDSVLKQTLLGDLPSYASKGAEEIV